MKACRIYNTRNNSGYGNEGFPGDYTRRFIDMILTDDGFVLSTKLCWRTLMWKSPGDPNRIVDMNDETAYEEKSPAKIVDGLKLYTPYDGTYISRDRDNNRLYLPFEVDGKWGYCYAYTGEVLLEPKWGFSDEFSEGDYARFNVGGVFDPISESGNVLWGLLFVDGDEVIPPVYQYLSRVEYGSMLAKKDGLWGVINTDGDPVITLEWDGIWFDYNNCWDSSHGYIVMKEEDGRKLYKAFNKQGKVMMEDMLGFIPPEFPKQYVFDDDEDELSDETEDEGV